MTIANDDRTVKEGENIDHRNDDRLGVGIFIEFSDVTYPAQFFLRFHGLLAPWTHCWASCPPGRHSNIICHGFL